MKTRLDLSTRDRDIIYAVAVYKYLSSFQLEALYFPNSDHRTATNRLTQLANPNYRFLSRVFSATKATPEPRRNQGTAVYFWTPENKRRLQTYLEAKHLAEVFADFQDLTPTDHNDQAEGFSMDYLIHELGVSDFFLSLEDATQRENSPLIFWERTSPLSKEVRALVPPLTVTITTKSKGETITRTETRPFNPDAIFLLQHPNDPATYTFAFLEYDNNTASPQRFNRKLDGYIAFEQRDLFPKVLDYYKLKYGLTLPRTAHLQWRVLIATANVRGTHHRRNDLYLASIPYKKYKRLLYASITDCTRDAILSPIWLRGKEYPTAKAAFTATVPPEATPTIQKAKLHDILNDPATLPRVLLTVD